MMVIRCDRSFLTGLMDGGEDKEVLMSFGDCQGHLCPRNVAAGVILRVVTHWQYIIICWLGQQPVTAMCVCAQMNNRVVHLWCL